MRYLFSLSMLVLVAPVLAQDFRLATTEPAAGTTNVPLETTITFTFSAPLDTTIRFSETSDWPVAFFAISPPDSIRIDSFYVNSDKTQLSFDVVHTEATDFVWVLTGAYDQAGRLLCRPQVLAYTTADQYGPYSVSGRIEIWVSTKQSCSPTGLYEGVFATLRREEQEGRARSKFTMLMPTAHRTHWSSQIATGPGS